MNTARFLSKGLTVLITLGILAQAASAAELMDPKKDWDKPGNYVEVTGLAGMAYFGKGMAQSFLGTIDLPFRPSSTRAKLRYKGNKLGVWFSAALLGSGFSLNRAEGAELGEASELPQTGTTALTGKIERSGIAEQRIFNTRSASELAKQLD